MEQPFVASSASDELLPNRFRYLTQRIQLLAEEYDEMATIMFDGHPNLYGGLGWQFNSNLYHSEKRRACIHITDAPSFVDSQTSAGIQIADMVASVIRQYEEAELFRNPPSAEEPYQFAIRRWYRIVEQKTRNDLIGHDGYDRPGFFRMYIGDL